MSGGKTAKSRTITCWFFARVTVNCLWLGTDPDHPNFRVSKFFIRSGSILLKKGEMSEKFESQKLFTHPEEKTSPKEARIHGLILFSFYLCDS